MRINATFYDECRDAAYQKLAELNPNHRARLNRAMTGRNANHAHYRVTTDVDYESHTLTL